MRSSRRGRPVPLGCFASILERVPDDEPFATTDGHDFIGFYLYVFLLYDVPAFLLLGLAYRLARVGTGE